MGKSEIHDNVRLKQFRLSWPALLFLLDRTDFSEPATYGGFGFSTAMKEALLQEAESRIGDDPVMRGLLDQIKRSKGW